MALEFTDSFDHYSVWADKGWQGSTNVTNPYAPAARNGGQGFRITHFDHHLYRPCVAESSKIVGFAWRYGVNGSARVIGFMESSGQQHINIYLDSSTQRLYVARAGTFMAYCSSALAANQWNYIELKAVIHDTTGIVVVRINGTETLNLTGQDTRNAGTGIIDRLSHGANSSGTWNADYDDYYVVGLTGGTATDFLGDVRISAQRPGGAGASTVWTPSAGSNYQTVDETIANGDTDYVSSGTVGAKDTYAFADVAGTGDIKGLQVNVQARKSDAGLRQIAPVYRPTTTDTDGNTITLSTSHALYREIKETNPDTGLPWTLSELNAAEFGVKVVA